MRIGGSQNKFDVSRRLFQRFEHRIKRVARQHVHFIDDIDLEASAGRRIQRVFQQLAHVIDLRVRRRIQLHQIDKASRVNLGAGAAFSARRIGNAGFAVERLGDNARQRGLAHTARAGKQVGVMQTLLLERITQRTNNMLLPDQFGK